MNPSSSSCKRKWDSNHFDGSDQKDPKNDVFVNYSSDDIGKTFVSHLLGALRRNGFTIFDHTMVPTGRDSGSELLEAIEESEIYVIVFSIRYGFSVTCLDELVDIMDCFGKFHRRKILPVFFHVEPGDVRNQEGSFKEAFEGHERNDVVYPERVKKWRQTLKDVGQLSGLHLQNGDEEKFVWKIVEELENMQNPQELHVTDIPIGIESRVQELISNLNLDSKNVSILAVLGISGIGKTTIVKATYNKIAPKFDASCFLADIHYQCKTPNWKVNLQKDLISCLTRNDKFQIIYNHNEGVTKIRKLITRRKVLLVLDDVDNFNQLQALGIDHRSFCNGSRIIVTTRDKQSLGILPHIPYNIRILSRRDSLELFTRLTFENGEFIDKKFVQEIVRCASGIPLVLEVWSRHFKHHEKEQWASVLETLKRIPHGDVQKQLQMSFDSLDKRGKKLFLDIACFFDGMYKDLVVEVLQDEVLAFFPDNHIRYLVDKGLVKMGFGKELLMIHAIREMGQEIVRQESEDEPGERTRLRDRRDVIHVLTECSGTEAVETIRLDFEKKEEVTLKIEGFRKMRNLRLIQLLDPQVCWSCSSIDHDPMMPSFSFKKLKYLEWHGFPLKFLNIDMDNVEVVRLEESKMEFLWEGMKSLTKLRILDVSSSNSLTKTGNFDQLKNLEQLRFHDCSNLEELHASIGCLQKLAILGLSNCTRLERFPWEAIENLRYLHDINLNHCPNLGLARDEIIDRFLASLKHCPVTRLHLSGCNISKISSEIGSLNRLRHLSLTENAFSSLPRSVSRLQELNMIELSRCANLLAIPDLPENVTILRAQDCVNLANLPSNMFELKSLRELYLDGCLRLGLEDPECFTKVAKVLNLKYLSMRNCNVSRVPSEIGDLTSLQILHLSGNTFSSLPDSFRNLLRLAKLKINDCSRLRLLPLLPSNLDWIEAFGCCSLDGMSFDSMITAYISRCPTFLCDPEFNQEAPKVYKKPASPSRLCISLSWNLVPNWCRYRSDGAHMISFVAPVHDHSDKRIRGMILCAATRNNHSSYWYTSVKIVNKTKETSYCVNQGIDPHCTIFVKFFELDDDTVVVEAGDIVVLKFLGKHAPKRIFRCDLRLTYDGDHVVDPKIVAIPSEMMMTTTMATVTPLNDISSESDDDDDDDGCFFPFEDDVCF